MKQSHSTQHHMPKLAEARDMISRFREAATEREKLKVINTFRQKFPAIADNFEKMIAGKP